MTRLVEAVCKYHGAGMHFLERGKLRCLSCALYVPHQEAKSHA